MTSGPPALPERETARGPQHGGKARGAVKAPKVLPCKARVIRQRPDCLNPSLQWWKVHTPRHGAWGRGHRYRAIPTFVVLTLPAGGRRAASPFKGTDRVPTSRSIRPAQGEFGMAYGARALWSRSVRSSRRSHDLPGRTGKPSTGPRDTGAQDQQDGEVREMRDAATVLEIIRERGGDHDEHWRAGCHENRARPVRRGAVGKGPGQLAPRRRPTLRARPVRAGGRWKRWRAGRGGARTLVSVFAEPPQLKARHAGACQHRLPCGHLCRSGA